MSEETNSPEPETAGRWNLGPQDEVGRWVFSKSSALIGQDLGLSHLAKLPVIGFHIGGVYGDQDIQQYALRILNELEARAALNAQPPVATQDGVAVANHAVACNKRESWVQTYVSRDEAGMPVAFEFRCADKLTFWLSVARAEASALETARQAQALLLAWQYRLAEQSRDDECRSCGAKREESHKTDCDAQNIIQALATIGRAES